MKDTIIEQCLLILKREDVKTELKTLLTPLLELIIIEIYPYIYFSLIFVHTAITHLLQQVRLH